MTDPEGDRIHRGGCATVQNAAEKHSRQRQEAISYLSQRCWDGKGRAEAG